jgi:hypothetical protein
MLERRFFPDLVVADMTVPNGKVHHEIGIRQTSRTTRARAGRSTKSWTT